MPSAMLEGGAFKGQELLLRLTISVYAARRGRHVSMVRAVGRTHTFMCLIRFIIRVFDRTFIITFLYFCSITHYIHKAERGKLTYVVREDGIARLG